MNKSASPADAVHTVDDVEAHDEYIRRVREKSQERRDKSVAKANSGGRRVSLDLKDELRPRVPAEQQAHLRQGQNVMQYMAEQEE